MLEEQLSRSGHRTLKFNGRLVASRENPIQEARRWVDSNRSRFLGRKNVFVLGVGCGYHLELLAQEVGVKKVIGLEFARPLYEWAVDRLSRADLTKTGSLSIIHLTTDLFLPEEIANLMSEEYAVLKFFPSTSLCLEPYANAYSTLLGRNQKGLSMIHRVRPDLGLDKISSAEPISINHFIPNTQDGVWKLLSELIK